MVNDLLKPQLKYMDELPETIYKGVRLGYDIPTNQRGICIVTKDDKTLENIAENDFDFEWGYRGKDAKNLAKSLLSSMFKEELVTSELCLQFVREVVESLPFEGWEIKETVLSAWLDTRLNKI
jgi:hypothetical protein